MDKNFFDNEIKKLISTFGDKAFTEHRVRLIRNLTKNISCERMAKITDSFINERRYAPLPSDFFDAVRESATQKQGMSLEDSLELQIAGSECKGCAGTGLINCTEKKTNCDYVFRCKCKAGDDFNRVSPVYPKWQDTNAKYFNVKIKNPWDRKAKHWNPNQDAPEFSANKI